MLNEARIAGMAEGLEQVADLPDPRQGHGRVDAAERPRHPQGARADGRHRNHLRGAAERLFVDAAALAFKAGSAILLRGNSSAYESNAALVRVMRESLEKSGVTPDAVASWRTEPRDCGQDAKAAREYIDLIVRAAAQSS